MPEDILCSPPVATLHICIDAGLQTPTHPDIVAFYLSRLQLVLTVEWLPQAMPDESHVFRKVVPGTLPGHRLRPAGVLLPSRGDPPQDRTAPPGPPPPDTTAPQAQYPPWMPPLITELLSPPAHRPQLVPGSCRDHAARAISAAGGRGRP